jgi:hypothetical protein
MEFSLEIKELRIASFVNLRQLSNSYDDDLNREMPEACNFLCIVEYWRH